MGVTRVISGGQTGADRAALDVAIELGIEYGGWCPAGGWAEDFPEPPGLMADYPNLRVAGSPGPAVRTRLNVRDSDATLVVRPMPSRSSGTDFTIETAEELERPLFVTNGADAREVIDWLGTLGSGITLNVAGPRESEQPGVYRMTRTLLTAVLAD
jgi:hypothetical protein